MQSVFGMSPHDWQEDAITHIITLSKDNSCAPLLLVWPMGGGKSAVRDMVGFFLPVLYSLYLLYSLLLLIRLTKLVAEHPKSLEMFCPFTWTRYEIEMSSWLLP
jgi:hypothetical protein